MNRLLKPFSGALFASMVLSSNSYAQSPVPNVNTGLVKISQISNWMGLDSNNPVEALNVSTNQDVDDRVNPANCSNSYPYILEVPSDISKSILLTSIVADSNVQLVIYGDGCTWNDFPQIVAVSIVN